jgi:hypothetical protein
MKGRTQLGIIGVALGVIGAILAFALNDEGSTADGVKLEPLGVILLSLGVILLAGLWLSDSLAASNNPTNPGHDDGGNGGNNPSGGGGAAAGIHAIGGLIAVVSGIIAVCILAAITLTQLSGKDDKEAIVAITTSAFGIISTVIGAYLGIKISSEAAVNASGDAKLAAVAKRDVQSSQEEVSSYVEAVDTLPAEQKAKVFSAVGRSQPSVPDSPLSAKDQGAKSPRKPRKPREASKPRKPGEKS